MGDEYITAPVEFKIFSNGALKAAKSADGKMRLHGIASSTTRDLHGDVMTQSAIDDMERAAANNLTIFLNHSYNVPEDVGGSVEKSRQMMKGVDQDGNPNTDLLLDILINDANPRAVQTWEAINSGTKLGLSIGANIPEGGAKRNKDGTYVIEHVDLLETSLVGIPANPRSWIEYAVKALNGEKTKDAMTIPLDTPTLTLDQDHYQITGTISNTNVFSSTSNSNVLWAPITTDNTSDNLWRSGVITIGEAGPEIIESMCPSCGGPKGGPKGGCSADYHKDAEPEITDSTITYIQIDTEDGSSSSEADSAPASQEAPSSSPESEGGLLDETADGDNALLGDDVTMGVEDAEGNHVVTKATWQSLMILLGKQPDLMQGLLAAKEAERLAIEARVKAETERNQAVSERTRVLRETKQLLDRLADTPLIRRTAVADAQAEFRARFGQVYDDDFLKVLERNNG